MKTLTDIAADIAANLAANMDDIQQRMGKLDAVLDDLRAAGVELEIVERQCSIETYGTRGPQASVSIRTTNHPAARIVRAIIEKHGGDWHITEHRNVLSGIHGIQFVHIEGVDL